MKKLILPLCLGFLASCQAPAPQSASMDRSAQNMARMQQFYDEAFNAHNPAMLDSFCTPDIKDHQGDPNHPDGVEGLEALRSMFVEFFTGYPDMHIRTNFMIASGDTVMAHITMTGTNSGPMGGMPPTNKQINVDGVDIVVIRDGKASEHWGYMEEGKMFMQLGMMPAPGAPQDTMAAGAM